MKDGIKERILCAAIFYKEFESKRIIPSDKTWGVVVCGLSHSACISTFIKLTGKRSVKSECGEYEQGFMTTYGRWVDRKLAFQIAVEANQVEPAKTIHSNQLFSEDLY